MRLHHISDTNQSRLSIVHYPLVPGLSRCQDDGARTRNVLPRHSTRAPWATLRRASHIEECGQEIPWLDGSARWYISMASIRRELGKWSWISTPTLYQTSPGLPPHNCNLCCSRGHNEYLLWVSSLILDSTLHHLRPAPPGHPRQASGAASAHSLSSPAARDTQSPCHRVRTVRNILIRQPRNCTSSSSIKTTFALKESQEERRVDITNSTLSFFAIFDTAFATEQSQ